MNPIPKKRRITDRKYLRWIKQQECLLANRGECVGITDPHHVTPISRGGSDTTVAPLCRAHHNEAHVSRKNFEAKYGILLDDEIARLRKEYAALNVKPAKAKKAILKPRIDCIAIICSCGLRHLPSLKQVSFEQDGMRYWCRKNRNYMVAEL